MKSEVMVDEHDMGMLMTVDMVCHEQYMMIRGSEGIINLMYIIE